jgi:hypothetical protein
MRVPFFAREWAERSGFVAPALLPVTKKKVWFCGSGISCGDLEMVCFG